MSGPVRKLLWACWLLVAERAARAYVAGPSLTDGVRVCKGLSKQRCAGTLCYWNTEQDSPRRIADEYFAALDAIAEEKLDCYLSIKAPPLGFSRDLMRDIADHGRTYGVRLHFDSHGPEAAEQTFALIVEMLPHHSMLGCTIPGRWRRSVRDAELAADLGLSVRVVKGQWNDVGQPDVDPRAGFLAVIGRLAGRARHVAVATHDPVLAHEGLARLCAAGTSCELELLFGLPSRGAMQMAQEQGIPVRWYVPYGQAWLPYCLSQARQNPRIFWWVFRDLLATKTVRLPYLSPS